MQVNFPSAAVTRLKRQLSTAVLAQIPPSRFGMHRRSEEGLGLLPGWLVGRWCEETKSSPSYRTIGKHLNFTGWLMLRLIPQQQNAMGSLHNIDFGVFWARWGGSGKEPGSGNRFRELVPGTSSGNWIRVSMGSDRFCGSKFRFRRLRERGFEGFGV